MIMEEDLQQELGMSDDYWRGLEDGLEISYDLSSDPELRKVLDLTINDQRRIRIARLTNQIGIDFFRDRLEKEKAESSGTASPC